ncbi:MAG: GtrA family protein [Deltaproteobacteria bacterium]|nr:GtrA family protein [Deltaproteobacteria bacterium]
MMKVAIKYAFFAALATATNVVTQFISLNIYNKQHSLYIAMAFGTLAGLVVKYVLDKHYIFYVTIGSLKEDATKFILYSLMGVLTTAIFWGVEILFNAVFSWDSAKYLGATLGLTIGYFTKYKLDKRYVFK